MFQQLPESSAVRRPRWGGSIVSTAAHAALISGAVALTATAGERPPEAPAPRVPFIAIAPTPPVAPPRVANAAPATSNRVTTTTPVLQVSTEIPLGLPDIDLTRAVVGVDEFASTRGGTLVGAVSGVPGGTGVVDASGAWLAEQVEKPVVMLPGSPAPTYPEALRSAGIAGSVMVEFVVDTLGRVEAGSGRVVSADHDQFAVSAKSVLNRLRFLPAQAQGRKVRQLVRLPFRFDLHS